MGLRRLLARFQGREEMTKGRKPRVPRPVVNPIEAAMRAAAPIQGADLNARRLPEQAALNAFAAGAGSSAHWARLVTAMNIAETMAKAGEGCELLEISAKAHHTLAKVYTLAKENGRWVMTPEQVWGMREAIEYHDLQRQSVALSRYLQHERKVLQTQISGAHGMAHPNDILDIGDEA